MSQLLQILLKAKPFAGLVFVVKKKPSAGKIMIVLLKFRGGTNTMFIRSLISSQRVEGWSGYETTLNKIACMLHACCMHLLDVSGTETIHVTCMKHAH